MSLEIKSFDVPETYRVIVARLRVRSQPNFQASINTKRLLLNEAIQARGYTFSDGALWLLHGEGWSVYTMLDDDGDPDYSEPYMQGRIITTSRQDSAVNNFVGTIDEVRAFMRSHQGMLFFIDINPDDPPEGSRQFSITTFPSDDGKRILQELAPDGKLLLTPAARRELQNKNQL